MAVTISSEAVTAALAHAGRAPDFEVCGLLMGQGTHVSTALPATNVAETPDTQFEVDPMVLIAANRAARSGGDSVLGCYHSHPSGSATPSATDLAMIGRIGEVWLIVARGEARLWQATSPATFTELPLGACTMASPPPKPARLMGSVSP